MTELQKESAENETPAVKDHLGWIMALYLIGLFLGSLNMGVITPVRTIIQSSLGVDAATGIWMINIFTLMYAAIIPVSGKLADRYGRKIVFLASILTFGIGSLLCGLSNSTDSFALLIAGRVIQGLGAGGIMPIATAEFGTSFPPEKRGMALGLVGGVYGIGSVLGATVGSAIVDIFGTAAWQWVFYMNIPFCVFILVFGLFYIPNHKAEQVFRIDKLGTLLMVIIIISLLYGLKNIDFFDFITSIQDWQAWAFILLAAVLIPLFVIVEKKAEDPIFHIEYMGNKQIVLTLLISLLVGMVMMGMVFIPQFAENALKMSSGAGGYFVIVLGLFAGFVSPVSGVLIDRFGEKGVMLIGLVISAVGSFFLAFVSAQWPNVFTVVIALILIGLGMGFTMGTPLNYMMMANTKEEESNSALATLSLVRSIGTAIAPALMVGFIIQAGSGVQSKLMDALPDFDTAVELSQVSELRTTMDELLAVDDELQSILDKVDGDQMKQYGVDFDSMRGQSVRSQLDKMDIDSMLNMNAGDMDMDMNSGDSTMPADLLEKMQNSDVTTIVGVTKELVDWVFSDAMGDTITEIQNGIGQGVDGIGSGIKGIGSGIDGINSGIEQMQTGISGMQGAIMGLNGQIAGIQAQLQQNPGNADLLAQLGAKQGQKAGMESGIATMTEAMNTMGSAVTLMEKERTLMGKMQDLMKDMKESIPGAFDKAKDAYKVKVDESSEAIETVYQDSINEGYRNMFILVGIFSVAGLILILFYKQERRTPVEGEEGKGHGHGHGMGHGHGHGKAKEAKLEESAQEA